MFTEASEVGLVYGISNVYLNKTDFVGSISSLVRFGNILELRFITTQFKPRSRDFSFSTK